jgi:hypothetical protein
MAKEDYLEGYGQGLKRGAEGPIMGRINKVLDKALGNPNESAKRGLDQGFDEMKSAKKAESNKTKIINKPSSEVQKFDENYKKGGKITAANYDKEYGKIYRKAVKNMSKGGSTASKRADGIAVRGKTKGKIC